MRYRIRLSYNGSALCGWQRQNNAPSVQQELSRALSLLIGCETEATGAGRTDAKVNAVNYIAHFDAPETVAAGAADFVYKINAILPAVSREYHYFIHRRKDPFMESFSYWCKYPLDMDRMNEAAGFLTGTHDFSCFEKTGSNNRTSVCTVYEAEWKAYTPAHVETMGYPAGEGDYIVFRIRANRFLRNMVRAIVGTLVDVGRGRYAPERVKSLIESGSRSDAGESVPGNALFLNKVEYPRED